MKIKNFCKNMKLFGTSKVNEKGNLSIGGVDGNSITSMHVLKMNKSEERQHVNYLISWISKYKSIYFEQECLLKFAHVSKRMKELIRRA